MTLAAKFMYRWCILLPLSPTQLRCLRPWPVPLALAMTHGGTAWLWEERKTALPFRGKEGCRGVRYLGLCNGQPNFGAHPRIIGHVETNKALNLLLKKKYYDLHDSLSTCTLPNTNSFCINPDNKTIQFQKKKSKLQSKCSSQRKSHWSIWVSQLLFSVIVCSIFLLKCKPYMYNSNHYQQ